MKATTYRAFKAGTNNVISAGTAHVNGRSFDDAVSALVANHSIAVSPSGHPEFVDSFGRKVSLYLRLDPAQTDKGREALRVHAEDCAAREAAQSAMVDELLDIAQTIGMREALRRLKP